MAKCCCEPQINQSKNAILRALADNARLVPASLPGRSTIFPSTEEIARRVADYLNKNDNTFESETTRTLEAITNALIALKSRDDNSALLKQIIRNQNDQFDLTKEYQRQTRIALDQLATREQAKDLLKVIASLRRDMLEQFKFSAREISARFAAVGAAIVALGLAQRAAFLAEIAAKAVQTATILRAIAALKFSTAPGGNIADLVSLVAQLAEGQLRLEPVTTSIPVCATVPGIGKTVVAQPVQSFAIADSLGRTTATYQQSVADMIYDLLASGQLDCGGSVVLASEVIGQIDKGDSGSDLPRTFYCQNIEPQFFVIALTEVDPKFIRTYKLAGSQSEYGAGNWAVVDSVGRVDGDFVRLFNQSQRLHPRTELSGAGVRLSLKRGISATITAYGKSNQ